MFRISLLLCLMLVVPIASAQQNTPPERPFTLLLITADGGNGGFGSDPRDQVIREMIWAPRSPRMQSWAQRATPKELRAGGYIANVNHKDIMQRAESLPILALVESSCGAVWDVMSGPTLPANEEQLAKRLDTYFAATVQAAQDSANHVVQSVSRADYDRLRAERTAVTRSKAFDFPVKLPEGFDLNANATVDPETQAWGTRLTIVVFGGVVLLSVSLIAAAWIMAEAMTDDK